MRPVTAAGVGGVVGLAAGAAAKFTLGEGIANIPRHLQLLEQQQQLAAMGIDPSQLAGLTGPSDSTPSTQQPIAGPAGGPQLFETVPGVLGPRDTRRKTLHDQLNQRQRSLEQAGAKIGFDALQMGGIQQQLLRRGGGNISLGGGPGLSTAAVMNAAAAQRAGIGTDVTGALQFAERRGAFGGETGTQQSMLNEFVHMSRQMGFEGMGEIVPNLQQIITLIEGFRTTGIPIAKDTVKGSMLDMSRTFGPIMGANIAMGSIRAQKQAGQTGPSDMMDMFMMRSAFKELGIDAAQGVSAEDYERALDLMATGGVPVGGAIDMMLKAGGGGASGRLLARQALASKGIQVGGPAFKGGLRMREGATFNSLPAHEQAAIQDAGGRVGLADIKMQGPQFLEEMAEATVGLGRRGEFKPGAEAPLAVQARTESKKIVEVSGNVLTAVQEFNEAILNSKIFWSSEVQPFIESVSELMKSISGATPGSGWEGH